MKNPIVADSDERFIHTREGWCYWALEPYPIVYNLWVVPECRGQGYGRKLLRMAIAEIRAAIGSERKIRIQAIPFDKGIYKSRLERFYRSEGLVVMKKEKSREETV